MPKVETSRFFIYISLNSDNLPWRNAEVNVSFVYEQRWEYGSPTGAG